MPYTMKGTRMGNSKMNIRESRRSRPRALAAVLVTVALAGGVLFPAAAPPSASARPIVSLKCLIASQIQNLRLIADLRNNYDLNQVLDSCAPRSGERWG
jgi:hypothetical protein